jgi:hypothetical protein
MAATVQQDPNNPRTLRISLWCDVCRGFRADTSGVASPSDQFPVETVLRLTREALEHDGWVWPENSGGAVICPPCHGNQVTFDSVELAELVQLTPGLAMNRVQRLMNLVLATLRVGRPPPRIANELLLFTYRISQEHPSLPLPDQFILNRNELQNYLTSPEERMAGIVDWGLRRGDRVTVTNTDGQLDGEYEVTGPGTLTSVCKEEDPPEIFHHLMEVLQEATPRPVYLHPESYADIRKFGKDIVELQVNTELLKRGFMATIQGFPLYTMVAVPKGRIYFPPPFWVPRREDGRLCVEQDISRSFLWPKPTRTRWDRMLDDDLD